MMELFEIHNLFIKSLHEFQNLDPHLSRLLKAKFVYKPLLLTSIPVKIPGIYILTGGRQVGKSTLIKLLIERLLLQDHVAPNQIFYLPCDTVASFQELLNHIETFEEGLTPQKPFYLFIDEVTYVREWDRAIKALADRNFFNNGSALISGSDSFILQEAMMRFPGRRGKADQTDFHLYPLSFCEMAELYYPTSFKEISGLRDSFQKTLKLPPLEISPQTIETLYSTWQIYLQTGGYLTALNSFEENKKILPSVYKTYVQWIVGDLMKRGKNEIYLRDIFQALIEKISSQITWNSLVASVRIEHHQTIADYVYLLERMGVVLTVAALREDKFRAAPKKARKIHFQDPFIFHAIHAWLKNEKDPYELSQQTLAKESALVGALVEGVMASFAARTFPAFYIKGEKEVDLVLTLKKSFLPIEIKWTLSPKPSELKQLLKYKNGIVATKGRNIGIINGAALVPIPLLALLLG